MSIYLPGTKVHANLESTAGRMPKFVKGFLRKRGRKTTRSLARASCLLASMTAAGLQQCRLSQIAKAEKGEQNHFEYIKENAAIGPPCGIDKGYLIGKGCLSGLTVALTGDTARTATRTRRGHGSGGVRCSAVLGRRLL